MTNYRNDSEEKKTPPGNLKEAGEEFYEMLASLFYAVAAADGHVHPREHRILTRIVTEEWKKINEDIHVLPADAHLHISKSFLELLASGSPNANAIADFRRYRQRQPLLFTEAVQDLIWRTVHRIAMSHAAKNKSELVILNRIASLLS